MLLFNKELSVTSANTRLCGSRYDILSYRVAQVAYVTAFAVQEKRFRANAAP
jgi:hypothetical protein